jgi:hypothetical protein
MRAWQQGSHNLPNRMRRLGFPPKVRAARFAPAVAVSALLISILAGAGPGCSLLLDYESNPYTCVIDSDCRRYAGAVCDNARKVCVPRLPSGVVDSGTPPADGGDGGRADGPGALTCELSFDNGSRLTLVGPDGGLRPLPEGP